MLNLQFDPFPVLATQRLALRKPRLEDAEALYKLRSDKEVMRYIPRPMAKTAEDAAAVIQQMIDGVETRQRIMWAMTRAGNDELIGSIGYVNIHPADHRAEVGYMLRPDCHGQGLMREALDAVLACGFEQMGLHSIMAITDPANTASRRLLEAVGFAQEGHFKEDTFWDGRYLDTVFYGLLAANWLRQGKP